MPGYVATIGEITEEEASIAVDATCALGLDYSGVDLVRTAEGPRVIEINYNPFLKTTEAVTRVDIAGAVVEALLKRVVRRPIG